jgi:DNA-damage-inducible protein D
MDREIVGRLHSSFEDMVRKHPDSGVEFWCARDLQMLLGYAQWRSFAAVIDKAITACQNSGYDPRDHFAHISKMVDIGSGASREIEDIARAAGIYHT